MLDSYRAVTVLKRLTYTAELLFRIASAAALATAAAVTTVICRLVLSNAAAVAVSYLAVYLKLQQPYGRQSQLQRASYRDTVSRASSQSQHTPSCRPVQGLAGMQGTEGC
eukprot:15181-Heterococcus_DN1.PRE.1